MLDIGQSAAPGAGVARTVVLACAALACCAGSARAQCPTDWTAPFEVGGPALDNNVFALCAWDPDGPGPAMTGLVVGGTFNNAGGQPALRSATFDGTWHAMGLGINNGNGYPSMAIAWDPDGAGPALAEATIGGFFSQIAGITVRNVSHWNGSTWAAFGAGTQDINNFPDVYCATMWDPDGPGPAVEQLVIGGEFTVAGGLSRRRIARWDGAGWQAFGTGMVDAVYSVTTWDPDGAGPANAVVVAGGVFGSAGGVAGTTRIAQWNGTAWSGVGSGVDGQVEGLTTWDPDGAGPQNAQLIASGGFLNAGGVPASKIARFDGTTWNALGTGLNNTAFVVKTWDPDGTGPQPLNVVAGGSFTTAGGAPANRVARWDGSTWSAIGTGTSNTVFELLSWDPDGAGPQQEGLVAGGTFTTAGGAPANHLAFFPACTAGPACDSIDFNNDSLFPDTADIDDFLSVFSGGPCSTAPTPGCNDIDFNNDSLFPDTLDIDSLLSVFSGGACLT